MATINPIRRQTSPSEEGYILVAVIFMLAIMIIAMTVAAPLIKKSIQRERELETMHRGKQYARAVKLYYKKFGTYPPNLDALVKTNDIRFLRKKYIDPTTGKDEWKIVRVGQQKTQTLGFFGQPIGGAGAPGAGMVVSGMPGANGIAGGIGQPGGAPIGGLGSSNSSGGATNGNSTDPNGGSASATDPGNGQSGVAGTAGNGATGTDPGSGTAFPSPGGQTFGGIGIMGFSPNSPKQSILVYRKKNHYSDWEFLYDALADQMMMQGGGNLGTIGQPVGNSGGGIGIGGGSGIGGGAGIGSGGSTFGPSGGSTPGGATPTPPTTPQQ